MPARAASASAREGVLERTTWSTFTWTTAPRSWGSVARPARIFWGIVRGGSPARALMRLIDSLWAWGRLRPLQDDGGDVLAPRGWVRGSRTPHPGASNRPHVSRSPRDGSRRVGER